MVYQAFSSLSSSIKADFGSISVSKLAKSFTFSMHCEWMQIWRGFCVINFGEVQVLCGSVNNTNSIVSMWILFFFLFLKVKSSYSLSRYFKSFERLRSTLDALCLGLAAACREVVVLCCSALTRRSFDALKSLCWEGRGSNSSWELE